jgi:hypothetical protein
MSINLPGETIPMACSCFLESTRNIQKENSVHSIINSGLKQLYRSRKSLNYLSNVDLYEENEEKLIEKKEKLIQSEEILVNQSIIEKQTSKRSNFETNLSYHFNNQPNILNTNDPYSNFLAPPI